MVNLAQAWAETYSTVSGGMDVEVSGGGSGTGIASLINGTCDIANSSRKIEPEEFEEAKRKTGLEPIEFLVGFDALAIYVHRNNPLEQITLEQLAGIYGESGTFRKWEDLGVTVPGCRRGEIVVTSRQSNSGTYHYFREAILGKKEDFRLGSLDMNGSKEVVELVGRTPCAIGFSGIAYRIDEVKMLPVARRAGDVAYEPTVESTLNKTYPIARPMYMYSAGKPSDVARAYLNWILSDEGQALVEKVGYVPVPKEQRRFL
jgi:phosphate transport system substrate-binding protein